MDFNLKQWRYQHESEQRHQSSARMPKLLLEPSSESSASALPLFVPEPSTKLSNLSAFLDITTTSSPKFSRMGGFFSLAQWQELELQTLIYRYMIAGASVPAELLQPIKRSLLSSSPYYLHHPLQHYTHYQPALLQSGYWGRAAMDPEPGRCRRTDGKKWRCSRDVVAGHKYCERHMHRGRNRSRKPVEIPTPPTTNASNTSTISSGGGGTLKSTHPMSAAPYAAIDRGTHYVRSRTSPSIDILHLSQRTSDSITENKSLFELPQNEIDHQGGSDGRVLRHFFDDWPRSLEESDNSGANADQLSSSTCLSMSIPGNSSSDVSLKLSTGTGDEAATGQDGRAERERTQLNWMTQWGHHQAGPMGGPLAEALRSSTTNSSSPTSVLHDVPRGTASETSFVSS